MAHYLVTGGSGFFGGVLKRRLLREGHTVVNIDLEQDEDILAGLVSIRGDIRDAQTMRAIFAAHRFDAVFHVAAQLAHGSHLDRHLLWSSNVDATSLLAGLAAEHAVRPFVFISSNCLWAANTTRPLREEDPPDPVEIYGQSKWSAEKILEGFKDRLNVVVLRSPTIMDSGRLGLLAILYEFIADNKTVWVVGKGDNVYQFIYAEDLATAAILSAAHGRSATFHIGSDNVPSMRTVYEAVISAAGSHSRVRSLPKHLTIAAMILAHKLRLSPLGPYHYKMIAENFLFNTTRIKQELGWSPTQTNEQMLLRAFEYYRANREEINSRTAVSAHRKPASMGVIRLLKWIS